MIKAIIVDLDGTLSDCEQRTHLVRQEVKDWSGFYDKLSEDLCNEWCLTLVRAMANEAGLRVILVTGRPEGYRYATEVWLDKHGVPFYSLYMRPANDHRQDYEVKKEIYEKYIKPTHSVLFAVEDRKQVVDMWRQEGIVCLQCAEGNF